jgi:tetratricopeptide (TPR) repeat protein
MSMNAPQPPTEEILRLVQACTGKIGPENPDEIARAFARDGSDDAEPTVDQLEAVYETACQLCDEGNFKFASALALHLATYRPVEPRFCLLAGTCMQQLGLQASAARFFCFSLLHGGDHPGALFRLGECLLALGDAENADRAFDAALDVSRSVEGADELQYAAMKMMDSIKSRAHAAP